MERKSFFKVLFGGIIGLFVAPELNAAADDQMWADAIAYKRAREVILNEPVEAGLFYPETELWRYGTWDLMIKMRNLAKVPTCLWDFRPADAASADVAKKLRRIYFDDKEFEVEVPSRGIEEAMGWMNSRLAGR